MSQKTTHKQGLGFGSGVYYGGQLGIQSRHQMPISSPHSGPPKSPLNLNLSLNTYLSLTIYQTLLGVWVMSEKNRLRSMPAEGWHSREPGKTSSPGLLTPRLQGHRSLWLLFSLCHSSLSTRPSPTQLPVQCSQIQTQPASFRGSLPKTQSPYFLAGSTGPPYPLCLSLQAHLAVEIRGTAEPTQGWSAHSCSLHVASPTPLLFTYHNFPTLSFRAAPPGSSARRPRTLSLFPSWHPPH